MNRKHYMVATAGHVDHGKSAVVKALTGTDPDRLPEEKARGITIDLGFAHLEIASPTIPTERFSLGVVDVPGHEDFVKNMVAGVGSIDLALLVVAADDGWMPQTEEHLQILAYLGVTHAVVAVTKMDLFTGEEALLLRSLRERLQRSPFATAPLVPVSVVNGRGLDALRDTLGRVLAETPVPRDIGKPRLPVDRVFTLHGVGTVVTGTLSGGPLHRGENVIVQPVGRPARIRSVQTHNQDVASVEPGMRVALNLPDIVAGRWSHEGVSRGAVITRSDLGRATDTLDVALERSPRRQVGVGSTLRPLKDGAIVRVHHAGASLPARVLLLDSSVLLPGERALAQVRFETPVFAFGGDRFIVRDWPEQMTLAGGMVLEPDADRRNFRGPAQRQLLEQRRQAPADPAVWVVSKLGRDQAIKRAGCLVKSRFSVMEIASAIGQLVQKGDVIEAGEWLVHAAWWQRRRDQAAAAIHDEHRAHPERPGLALTALRQVLAEEILDADVFDALVAQLLKQGFARVGTVIKAHSHRPALPPALQAAGTRLRASLAAKPFAPPARKELAADAASQTALRFLLETGEAVELGPDAVLSAENYQRAMVLVTALLRRHGAATAGEIRQALGTTRRVVIPLLEQLDRDGVTVRHGDQRRLRQP